jgi:hypothetical protein
MKMNNVHEENMALALRLINKKKLAKRKHLRSMGIYVNQHDKEPGKQEH